MRKSANIAMLRIRIVAIFGPLDPVCSIFGPLDPVCGYFRASGSEFVIIFGPLDPNCCYFRASDFEISGLRFFKLTGSLSTIRITADN